MGESLKNLTILHPDKDARSFIRQLLEVAEHIEGIQVVVHWKNHSIECGHTEMGVGDQAAGVLVLHDHVLNGMRSKG